MKTSTWLTTVLSLAIASHSLTATAQDPRNSGPRYSTGYNSVPNPTFLGLPMPQQWSGPSRSGYGQAYVPAGYSANCANGQCQTGNCPNGQCSPAGCPNGQCLTGACASGQCSTGRCPNGNCGTTPSTNRQYPQGVQSGWSPRNSRATMADSFRRSGQLSDADAWTPRSGLNPLDDALSSRYRRNDLDLKSEYFGGESRSQYELRAPMPTRSRANSDERTYPSRRSMEAPAETFSGVARF